MGLKQVSDIELPETFDIEEDFDHRTMYCEADISDMTGWNAQTIEAEIKAGRFPGPLNRNTRAPGWSRIKVDIHYAIMIAQSPSNEEAERIERYCDQYEEAYREALAIEKQSPTLSIQILQNQARAIADQMVDRMKKCDAEEEHIEEAWEHYFEEALSEAEQEHEDFIEISARPAKHYAGLLNRRKFAMGQSKQRQSKTPAFLAQHPWSHLLLPIPQARHRKA